MPEQRAPAADIGEQTNKQIIVGFETDDTSVTFNRDKELLGLAKWVLFGLLFLIVFVFSLYVFKAGDPSKEIFEFVKISVPPIVTLILGAYFKERSE